jgi:hypothetical protein
MSVFDARHAKGIALGEEQVALRGRLWALSQPLERRALFDNGLRKRQYCRLLDGCDGFDDGGRALGPAERPVLRSPSRGARP